MRRDFNPKKLALISVLCFCLFELIDWTGIWGKRFPKSWGEALVQAFVNVLWVALFMGISLFGMARPRP
jgi:hypothetical protein